MAEELKPAYLIAGDDSAKLGAALSRLRARAEGEGGEGALETFPATGGAGPDIEALCAAVPAISLMAERRYLLADGVERWRNPQVKRIAAVLADLPPDLTVVLLARGDSPRGLADAVKQAGGEVLAYAAPGKRELPRWVAEEGARRGIRISAPAARLLVDRLGSGTARLATELDRIALWAEPGATIGTEEVEELVTDTSERAGWTLGDAIVARDPADAVAAADGLLAQGEAVTPMIYGMASRLRNAHLAACLLEQGRSARDVEAALPMAPYPSKLLVRAVRGVPPAELSDAITVTGRLEWWTRGGADYGEQVALILAVRDAAGGASA